MVKAIGIDLGTTYSAVSILSETGQPIILENQDGDKLTPSVVFFQTVDGKDEPLVGIQAKNFAATQPDNVVQYVKRQIGDPNWKFDSLSDHSYSAEEISAIILKRLKEGAENALGHEVTDAVITVPAYFDDARRVATRQAGEIAGLNVLRVLNEPTAAALAYGLSSDKSETVLVYDLGGGTFDVTLMKIENGHFDVLGTDGDRNLGGFDFDNALAMLIAEKMEAEGAEGVIVDPDFAGMLREKAEATKRSLTTIEKTNVFLDYKGKPYKISLTREEFEKETEGLVQRTQEILEDVIEEAQLSWEQVDHVLLVGGSTRMPMIRANLEKNLGRSIQYSINPDEAVATGAAIQAALEAVNQGVETEPVLLGIAGKIEVSDVTSQALGVLALSPETGNEMNSIIIPKNAKIPSKHEEVFSTVSDNQASIRVQVTQGDDIDPEFVTIIGESTINLPGTWPKNTPIKITFHYDIDQTVFVEVYDQNDTLVGHFEIERTANMSSTDLQLASMKIQNLTID
ncbi:Hsp70 family protein [Streptococcus sp. ZJ93]|uniref:Hsp70 family protein n=1 Tax=Streptococcus handemini TaxID=3161188 RepID=UPI0032EE6DA1